MSKILNIISESMSALGLNYEFGVYNSSPAYPYWVGEYQEAPPVNEDGLQETSFILTGFTRGDPLGLENDKEKIKSYFPKVGGKVVIAEGSAVAIFYDFTLGNIPTGDAELKKIQVNLSIKEWSVN